MFDDFSVGEVLQELDEASEVSLLVVIHREMTAIWAIQIPTIRQSTRHHLHVQRIH
jgi:hypothetical protein